MRTHPDIGLVIADLLQLARFWLCMVRAECAFRLSVPFIFATGVSCKHYRSYLAIILPHYGGIKWKIRSLSIKCFFTLGGDLCSHKVEKTDQLPP